MKAEEIRDKTVEELQSQLQELYKDQFNNRMQNGFKAILTKIHLAASMS